MADHLHLRELMERDVLPRQTARSAIWDALWCGGSIGRVAVHVTPSAARLEEAGKLFTDMPLGEPALRPSRWTPKWEQALRGDLAYWYALWQCPGDGFPSLNVPRFVHGQSQGICDLFAAHVQAQDDGNMFVHPLPPDPARIAELEPGPLASSMYWGAVEYLQYARAATGGMIPFRGPIMTGPFDTANYLLGTTVLMEWVYTQPDELTALLDRLTALLTNLIQALRQAAGGALHGHHLMCTRGGSDFASECRSLVSREMYEQYEAPRLQQLGRELGNYAIHSCGSWARTIASARRDRRLRAMNGQVRENDLAELCALAAGTLLLSIGPSVNLPRQYTFATREEYLEYVLARTPAGQPLELSLPEEEIPLWNRLAARRGMKACLVHA